MVLSNQITPVMESLSAANRAALALRFASVFPGLPFPNHWSDLNLTQQMLWLQADEQAARICRGDLTAAETAALLTETLSPEAPPARDLAAERQELADQMMATLNSQTAEMAARNAERTQASNRQMDNSIGAYS